MEFNRCNENLMDLFNSKKLLTVCAPMVRYSKLQFRNLVREYNCDLCFTPMILADSFCQSEKARYNEFSTNVGDSPLVVQFASNTVHDFVGASHMVAPYCNGVDLNCGCPQRWAKAQGIGCTMLENPQIIYDVVRQCRNHINKPFTVSVKMRILSNLKKSVSICQQLEHCGVSFLTVHGRTAAQHSVGEVNHEALKLINDSVNCPVIANGGVKNYVDVLKIHEASDCAGVMVASNLLSNPALFSGYNVTPLECVQKWLDICYNSVLDLNNKTKKINYKNDNLTYQCFHHHLVFMMEKLLPKTTRKFFNDLQSFDSVLQFLFEHFQIEPTCFSLQKYTLYNRLSLSYVDDKYLELKNCHVFNCDIKYNSDLQDGKFFNYKKNIDDMDTCISSLFLD